MLNEKIFKKELVICIENGKYVFHKLHFSGIQDSLDKFKNKLKRFSYLYSLLIKIVSPVLVGNDVDNFLKRYIKNDTLALNIGSGNTKISANVYNVDIFSYDNVDVVCNIEDLPFKNNSIDLILNLAVLEHVPNPKKVIDEIQRVLKPGGVVYTAFPFIQGFHASPYDFTRVTQEGIKILHQEFELIEVKPFGGPTSGMLWILQEWIAILFSFGNKKLHMLIYIVVMVLTFPFKYLDYFLLKHPMAKNISSGFIFIGKKK